MKTIEFPELSAIRTEIDVDVREAHLAEITSAARAASSATGAGPRVAWRRWIATVAVTGGALVPVAAAASDSALPGDALYDLKRTLEPIVRVVDRNVVAEHRIEELEALIDRVGGQDHVDELIADARAALVDVPDTDLETRLTAVVDHVEETDTEGELSDRPADSDSTDSEPPATGATDDPAPTTTTTTVEPTTTTVRDTDRTTTTTRARDGDSEPGDTTTTSSGSDGAPPADGDDSGDSDRGARADDQP